MNTHDSSIIIMMIRCIDQIHSTDRDQLMRLVKELESLRGQMEVIPESWRGELDNTDPYTSLLLDIESVATLDDERWNSTNASAYRSIAKIAIEKLRTMVIDSAGGLGWALKKGVVYNQDAAD